MRSRYNRAPPGEAGEDVLEQFHTRVTRPATFFVSRLLRRPVPEGRLGVVLLGHRHDVGGLWDRIGALQFDFMRAQGLRPTHVFLDIACGSLRGGVHFIRYLDSGNYLGLDKEGKLIEMGLERELGSTIATAKRPEFVVSECFEFDRFSKTPHLSIAQSLFTHLTPEDIGVCLHKLRAFVDPGHTLFATFNEGNSARNSSRSHAHGTFEYSRDEMAKLGERHAWKPAYVGDWGHPRRQKMMRYVADS